MTVYTAPGINLKLEAARSSMERISAIVNEYFGVTEDELKAEKPSRKVIRARQIAIYFMRKKITMRRMCNGTAANTPLSFKLIGKFFGYNHANCLIADRVVKGYIDTDKLFKAKINEVEKLLK